MILAHVYTFTMEVDFDMSEEDDDEIVYGYLFPRRNAPAGYTGEPPEEPELSFFEPTWGTGTSPLEVAAQKKVLDRFSRLMAKDLKNGEEWPEDDWVYFSPALLMERITLSICPFCGVKLDADNASLDRIDNTKHHTARNVHITCINCNYARSDYYSAEEFQRICLFLLDARKMPIRPSLADTGIFSLYDWHDNEQGREGRETVCTAIAHKIQASYLPNQVKDMIKGLLNRDLSSGERNDIEGLLKHDGFGDWVRKFVCEQAFITPMCTYKSVYVQPAYQALVRSCVDQIAHEIGAQYKW